MRGTSRSALSALALTAVVVTAGSLWLRGGGEQHWAVVERYCS
jgi:hypothetical protein